MKKLFALLPILIIVAASCRPKGGMDANTGYFSMAHYIDSVSAKFPVVTVNKTLLVDRRVETHLVTDSLKKLIGFIKPFDLNKPSNKGAYSVEEKADSVYGFTRHCTTYTLKDGEKLSLKRFVIIDGDGEQGNYTIAFNYKQTNLLSELVKTCELRFNKVSGFQYCVFNIEEGFKYSTTKKLTIRLKSTTSFSLPTPSSQ
jgi:hypothetical protein